MKKVVFIIPCIGSGGAERVVVNLCNELSEHGKDIGVITILSNEEQYHLSSSVKHYYLGETSHIKLIRVFQRFIRLRNLIKKIKPDTVIAFDRTYGITSCLGLKCRLIGSERNDPYSNMKRNSIQKKFRDWLYKKADVIVFQTEYAKEYFDNQIQEKSVIIPNPVNTNCLPAPYSGIRNNRVVTACRLTEQKNLPMMIDAFASFVKVYPEYELVIYGEGHLLDSLKAYVEKKGVGGKVSFPGYVNDWHERINSAAMYVSSSDYEGISNSMLEAMAIGLPVICTDCPAGGAAMVIQNGINGYLVPVKQADAMTKAMCKVVEEKAHTLAISHKAVEVREKYSVQEIANMWEKIL